MPSKDGAKKPRAAWGWLITGLCCLAYLGSGQSLAGNDATANVHLAPRLLGHGTVYFTVRDNPKMFVFAARTPYGWTRASVLDWNAQVGGTSAREAFERGDLRMAQPRYYLVPTRHPGKFASTFGLGAGLFALPVMGPALLVTDLESQVGLLWWLGKVAAALSVAATVLLLFLAGSRWLGARAAAVVALAYGLGSCAFCVSSQALWQHGPSELFVALGAYGLLVKERRGSDILCGFGFAVSVVCRPTSALVFASVGTYLLLFDRGRLLRFALGALPVVIVLMGYHQHAFGSPWVFGEMGVAAKIAMTKTGNPDVWQTPLHVGLAGLLLSPARGLLLYSPIALFSVWGAWRAFRDPAWKDLRPLAAGAVLQVLLAAKWFDWWGGWCFGYRVIVDIAILLAFLSFPIAAAVNLRPWRRTVFGSLLAYSVGVQVIGAYVFDLEGWNAPVMWQVATPDGSEPMRFEDEARARRFAREHGGRVGSITLNIDKPKYRGRLWSLSDSPLVHYLANISESRARRRQVIERFLSSDG
ncbi:MAG: hypothetical protein JW940_07370 [Polyangiaceae bacterium]|nr:hypothetical protein [Polyangiaceae bacterium]